MEQFMTTEPIGERIMTRRKLRGLSIRRAAELADMSPSTWSRIENGLRGADNLQILASMSMVLRCSVMDLIGDGYVSLTSDGVGLVDDVHDILAALIETALEDEATADPASLDYLDAEADLLEELYRRGDFTGTAARLAPYLRRLHATAVTATDTATVTRTRELTVQAAHRTMNVMRSTGQRADTYLAGERARDAAAELDDLSLKGIAAFTRAHAALSCGSMERGHKFAAAGLRLLDGGLADRRTMAVAGQLHLTSAMTLYGLKRESEAETHLAEAEDLATRTGDCGQELGWFGPTNLAFWMVAMEVDRDPRRALVIANTTNPRAIDAPTRQASFYLDAARACSRIGSRDSDRAAIRMIASAENVAPQRIRFNPLAREVLRIVVRRTKENAIDSQLRGLCERIGVKA
jgi:transcriptional regulator with XRE-family HTH domain